MLPSYEQLVEQRLGLFQIGRVEPFGEPAVDGRQKIASLTELALVAPEARQALTWKSGKPQKIVRWGAREEQGRAR